MRCAAVSIEYVRVSSQAKDLLVRLKRVTGIKHWNVLCRWAFCVSLAESSAPAPATHVADSNVEMSWKVFGGRYADIYSALLKERCISDGLDTDDETLAQQFRLHLHRGISYLAGDRNLRRIEDLNSLALRAHRDRESLLPE